MVGWPCGCDPDHQERGEPKPYVAPDCPEGHTLAEMAPVPGLAFHPDAFKMVSEAVPRRHLFVLSHAGHYAEISLPDGWMEMDREDVARRYLIPAFLAVRGRVAS